MNRKNLVLIAAAVLLTFTTFYAPQPLLPLFTEHFQVSEAGAALLISVTMLPLCVAPVAYGLLLQSVSARRILIGASGGLAVTVFVLAMGPGYYAFLGIRFLQGLLLPAMMTGLMTYVASSATAGNLSRALSAYVAMTVVGGFLGRVYSGQVTELIGWQGMFGLLGAMLTALAVSLCWLKGESRIEFGRIRARAITGLLAAPGIGRAYTTIFCAFFVFSAMLSFLPFRLAELAGEEMGPGRISLIYGGYLMGVAVALSSGWFIRCLGSERRVILAGLAVYLVATLLFAVPSIPFLFINMFLFCAGMFTIHGILPGVVNRLGATHRGVANGLYLSAYYLGGTLGAFAPGFMLKLGGWNMFIVSLAIVLLVGFIAGSRKPTGSVD